MLTKKAIKTYFRTLSPAAQKALIEELNEVAKEAGSPPKKELSRREILNNKQGVCPHCGHPEYVKYGIDKGAQRYKCKSCKRNFTEYTGTWMAGIHKKNKIDDFKKLVMKEKSLDTIKTELSINKKTAFDWRHKMLNNKI